MLELNLNLIIAQIITFLVGLFFLWLVAYKPMRELFRKRAAKIRQDLEAAEAARLKMEAAQAQYQKELETLTQKAQAIIQQATRDGQQVRENLLQEARQQGQHILQQAEERISIAKEKALKEMRQEVVKLSLQVAEKIIAQSMNDDLQQRLIDQALEQISERQG
ncbi:MAG: F0F1 ATP synthase subunit B [Lentisphaerae bacterium]|nr:F0F1 ATP synthase subunit B [Lentisphaerota bacterium]